MSLQVRATIVADQAVTRGEFVSLGRSTRAVLFIECVIGNTRIVNCFLFVPRICTIVCN